MNHKMTIADAFGIAIYNMDRETPSGERWASIFRTLMDGAPSGSGFDRGTFLDEDLSSEKALLFNTSFHHMDEHGFYDGWTDHTVTVKPTFGVGIDVTVKGKDKNEIRSYIADVFSEWLSTEIDINGL